MAPAFFPELSAQLVDLVLYLLKRGMLKKWLVGRTAFKLRCRYFWPQPRVGVWRGSRSPLQRSGGEGWERLHDSAASLGSLWGVAGRMQGSDILSFCL